MEVFQIQNTEIIYEDPGVIGRKLKQEGNVELVHLTIAPGHSVATHSLPIPVIFSVLSGTGMLQQEGKSVTLTHDSLVRVEPDTERSWINMGSDNLELLAIKISP